MYHTFQKSISAAAAAADMTIEREARRRRGSSASSLARTAPSEERQASHRRSCSSRKPRPKEAQNGAITRHASASRPGRAHSARDISSSGGAPPCQPQSASIRAPHFSRIRPCGVRKQSTSLRANAIRRIKPSIRASAAKARRYNGGSHKLSYHQPSPTALYRKYNRIFRVRGGCRRMRRTLPWRAGELFRDGT